MQGNASIVISRMASVPRSSKAISFDDVILSARKEPGKYVEGVVLSDNLEALFRNVPPPLSLALAMTEKHEKAERAELMREYNCSELEAVHLMAERIAQHRGG